MCFHVLHALLLLTVCPLTAVFILFPTLLKHLLAHDFGLSELSALLFMHESLSVSLWQKFLIAILFSSELRNTKFLKKQCD